MKTTDVRVVRVIQAPPERIFEALTQAFDMRGWLCHEAYAEPRKDGFIRLRWNSGYNIFGAFTALTPPRTLSYTWLSTYEPGETQVKFTLKPVEGGTKVTLTHSGFGTGKKWAGRAQESEEGWTKGLDNLKSVLETGIDLREAQRPRIGLGFETTQGRQGALLTDVMPDAPASAAGLQKGDVVVSLDGHKVRDEDDLLSIFQRCRAGQRIKAVYVRDGKRSSTTIELTARPTPQIPDDPAAVVEQARQVHEQSIAALRTAVAVLTEEQASLSPAEGEWSVKHIITHLCVCEPAYQSWAAEVLLGQEPEWIEAKLPEQFAGVLSTAPTLHDLLNRLELNMAESRAFVAALTPEHRAYKGRYRRIAHMLLDFAFHVNTHIEQVRKTIQAVA